MEDVSPSPRTKPHVYAENVTPHKDSHNELSETLRVVAQAEELQSLCKFDVENVKREREREDSYYSYQIKKNK